MPSPSVPRTPHAQPTSTSVQSLDGVYLRHAIDEYRAFSLAGDPGSVDAFTADCLARWTARWGSNRLHSLGPDLFRRYFGDLCRRGYSPPQITREKSLIAAFCRWAEKRYSGGDVAASQSGAITAWNAAEQRRLLHACRGLDGGPHDPPPAYLYPLVLFALKTGLRFQDLLQLEWGHLEGALERIRLPAAKTWSGRTLEIPLQRDARSLLVTLERRAAPSSTRAEIVAAMGAPFHGGKPDTGRIHKDFEAARVRAGIRAGNIDSLRLTFIRNCASARIPMTEAARLSDCRNRQVLVRVYSMAERAREE